MKKILCIIFFLFFLNLSCFTHDKQVNCRAEIYVFVINEYGDTVNVVFSTSIAEGSYIEKFALDSFILDTNQFLVDTVFYKWEDHNDCWVHCGEHYGYQTFTISAHGNDGALIFHDTIFPCDSTEQLFIDTCADCLMTFYDTVVIKQESVLF